MKVFEYSDKQKISTLLKGKKVVLVGGCFDILHFGHIKFLEKAKKNGNFLVVALESDITIFRKKKKKPFHNIEERAEVLSAVRHVDLVIKLPFFNKDEDYFKMTKFIKPSVIAITKGDKMLENKKRMAKATGGKILTVSKFIKNFSSTNALEYETIFSD
ncbi:MAG: adenylyltransferase/cytidyltransferase family protein [Patescibacteria group bacterium]